jgi:hypothetical protein
VMIRPFIQSFFGLVALSLAAMALFAPGARANDAATVPSEVLVVLGSSEGQGIDAELSQLGALHKPPFDGFTKKTLLKRADVTLVVGKDSEVALPNGRTLRLSLVEKLPDGRYRLRVAINRPGERDYLPLMTVSAAPGDPFFIAGQKFQGGTLILGVRVTKAR